MLEAIVAILAGSLASSSYIITRKPEARDILEKLVPYQGILGALVLFWSIRGIFRMDFDIMGIALIAAQFIVGFLLSYQLLSKYLLNRNEDVEERGIELRSKLVNYQIPAGLALIVLGVINLLF